MLPYVFPRKCTVFEYREEIRWTVGAAPYTSFKNWDILLRKRESASILSHCNCFNRSMGKRGGANFGKIQCHCIRCTICPSLGNHNPRKRTTFSVSRIDGINKAWCDSRHCDGQMVYEFSVVSRSIGFHVFLYQRSAARRRDDFHGGD